MVMAFKDRTSLRSLIENLVAFNRSGLKPFYRGHVGSRRYRSSWATYYKADIGTQSQRIRAHVLNYTQSHHVFSVWQIRKVFKGMEMSAGTSRFKMLQRHILERGDFGRVSEPAARDERRLFSRHMRLEIAANLSTSDYIQFIKDNTEITRNHLTPELALHLITPACPLWSSPGHHCPVTDPFWAFYWPGGQALTRYLLDEPSIVRGKAVLDVGSGCGASAMASSIGGARVVVANDVCPVAAEAIKLNMAVNKIHLQIDTRNLIGHVVDKWDVVLLGDMFYDDEFTQSVTSWLEALHSQGKRILIGDPGRVYLKTHPIRKRLRCVYSVDLLQHTMEENNGLTNGFVWSFC